MQVKEIEKSDFAEVLGLIREEFPYVSFNEEKIGQRIASGNYFLFKAVDKNELLGFVELQMLEGKVARINGLTVKPEHRKKGVAKKLLDYVLGFLKKKGVGRVLLLVKQGNEAAKRVYSKAGFKFIGLYNRELDNAVVEEMELDFAPKGKEDLGYVG